MHVMLARVFLPQAISHPLAKEQSLASLMFSIAVGTASTEQVPSRVFLLPSLNSGHLGNGAVEGGTQGVLDPSSVFISGE